MEINGNKGKSLAGRARGTRSARPAFHSGRCSPERLHKKAGVGNRNGHPVVTCQDCPVEGSVQVDGVWGNILQEGPERGQGLALTWGEGKPWEELCQGDKY